MKKTLFILLIIFYGSIAFGQAKFNVPDLKKINKSLSGKNAGQYGRLTNRMQANDTTLTLNDYRLLYYGASLQPAYAALKDNLYRPALQDSLFSVFSRAQSGAADFREVKALANKILDEFPFDIKTLDISSHASRRLNDDATAAKIEVRIGRILETIFNTGDGLTQKTAFYIISAANEADMIRALGFTPTSPIPQSTGLFHFRQVKENQYGVQGFYFQIL